MIDVNFVQGETYAKRKGKVVKVEFETAFSDFIERKEYDQAESALFSMVNIAFKAGWLAAGGKPLKPQSIIEIFHSDDE